jgi:hypothetical protein
MDKKEFQALRTVIGVCRSIRTAYPDKYARLREMFERHPTAGIDIIDLRAARNPVWGGIDYVAVYPTGEWVISANECFYKNSSKPAHDNRKIKRAARAAVRDQIEAFRNSKPCLCGSRVKMEVDHVRHFDDLITTFLDGRVPTEFDYTDGCEPIFREPIATEWRDFHQANAELRMLCKKCNAMRPRWTT